MTCWLEGGALFYSPSVEGRDTHTHTHTHTHVLEGGALFYSPSVCGKGEREGALRKQVPLAFVSAVSKIPGGSKGMYTLHLRACLEEL